MATIACWAIFGAAGSLLAADPSAVATPADVEHAAVAAAINDTFRLHPAITAYVVNPDGKDFTATLDIRDINLTASGPREVLVKIYAPDGSVLVRQIVPDDGVASANYLPRIGGWDHELAYYAYAYDRGVLPTIRWSAYSDPARIASVAKRTFSYPLKGAKGVYRILLAGDRDHIVTLKADGLKYAVAGHNNCIRAHGDQLKESYIYVPKGATGVHMFFGEVDEPRDRQFKLTAPDGTVLFDGNAVGVLTVSQAKFAKGVNYDGKLLKLTVSQGKGDYIVHIVLQQPSAGAFKGVYVGMGSLAVFARDEATAEAVKGGTIEEDGELFWNMYQVELYRWVKAHGDSVKGDAAEMLKTFAGYVRAIAIGDGPGSGSWSNWAYGFGYYGTRIWRPAWVLMKDASVPKDLKEIIQKILIAGADRLSFAYDMERCNGNAFSMIPPALWYAQAATGDAIVKQRYNTFFDRWRQGEGWGEGTGIGPSGDPQEDFGHDNHYGSYMHDIWGVGTDFIPRPTWPGHIPVAGILKDTDDPRFQQVYDRHRMLYSYLLCMDAANENRPIAANPWSARTTMVANNLPWTKQEGEFAWKCQPGPDLTVNVNDGSEWFAARRKDYYMLTFSGRLTTSFSSASFLGQVGYGGGAICQLTVPGKGTVLASTLNPSAPHNGYGYLMAVHLWRTFHVHTMAGELDDGTSFASGVSEHADARLEGNRVISSGLIRERSMRIIRSYTYGADSIDCEARLEEAPFGTILGLWKPTSKAIVREAWELLPYVIEKAKVSATAADEKAVTLGATPMPAKTIVIDRGGFGVRIELEKETPVMLGGDKENGTVFVQVVDKAGKPVDLRTNPITLKYKLVPFAK